MIKLGIVGFGNMATAIADGALRAGVVAPSQLVAYDVNESRRQAMAERGIAVATDLTQLADCRFVLLSVKPQVAPTVLPRLGELLAADCVIISIAAGISTEALAKAMGRVDTAVVRVMPNTPLMVGEGATAICRTSAVSDADFAFAKGLFAATGVVSEIDQSKMNEIIAVQGSTPAFIYLITKYFCEYAQQQGIAPETANQLFCQTLVGSARMMTETGMGHQQLIDMVTSPGGTTLMGLQSLEQSGIKQTIFDCCEATVRRAYELGDTTK